MECPKCGYDNREGAKFCSECGTSLQYLCPQCSAEVQPTAKFCSECGADLGSSQTATPPPEPTGKDESDIHRELQPDSITETTPNLQGDRRLVTVMFADVSGFTAMSEKMDPEQVRELINSCFDHLVPVVTKYEGTVDKFIGDEIMVLFGAPLAHENDPERALRAALEMMAALSEFNGEHDADLGLHFGINTGLVIAGGIGVSGRQEYSVMGDTVNLAARLEGESERGEILVGPNTFQATKTTFEFEEVGPVRVKGKAEPVAVYKVLSLLSKPGKVRGIEGLRAELIGRDDEFIKLKESLTEVLKGQGGMVSLIAEAGIGKSRLVTELKEYLQDKSAIPDGSPPFQGGARGGQSEIVWLEGRCLELGMTASYWPFIDIFHEYFSWSSEDDEGARAQSIVSSLGDMVKRGDLTQERSNEIGPLLGNLLSLHFGNEWDEELKSVSPEQIQGRTFTAVRDFLLALCKREPVIIVFEDLHWADNLSLDLISVLMEVLKQGALFLLCNYRPEKEHKCWDLANIARRKCPECYTELVLRELTPQQSARLVESLLRIENLPPSMKELILNKSQGNPFFVEEVIRSLIDRELVYQEGEDWKAREEISDLDVPDMIQNLVLARVDRLEADSKNVLEYASVIGPLFKYRLLEHLVEKNGDLEGYLSELKERDLVYEERTVPEVEYAFKHVLTQEATYQSILERRRRGFHKQVAEGIENLYGEQIEEHLEELAYHYSKSDEVGKAVGYLLKAGGKAARNFANEAAIDHFQKGLELLKTLPEGPEKTQGELDFQIALGLALILTKGHSSPEVGRTYTRARELCSQVGESPQLFHVLLGLRRFYFVNGEIQTAKELGEQLIALAGSLQDPIFLARAHLMLAETLFHSGDFVLVREHCEQGIAYFDPEQGRSHLHLFGNDTGGMCQTTMAMNLWCLGYPDQALKRSREALHGTRELSHPFSLGTTLTNVVFLDLLCREGRAAQEKSEEMIEFSRNHGFTFLEVGGANLQGGTLIEQGKPEEGIVQLRQGIATSNAIGFKLELPFLLGLLANGYKGVGQVEEGLRVVAEALTTVEKTGERMFEAELYRLKGELLLSKGAGGQGSRGGKPTSHPLNLSSPEECFRKALEIARSQKAKSFELRAAMSLSRLWDEQGRREEARKLLGDIYGWFTEGFETKDLIEAKELLDELS